MIPRTFLSDMQSSQRRKEFDLSVINVDLSTVCFCIRDCGPLHSSLNNQGDMAI